MTLSFAVTKRAALFGDPDEETGWYRKTFFEDATNQEMIIQDKGATVYFGNIGVQATYKKTGFAVEPYTIDDEVVNAAGFYYRIVSREDIRWANSLICYRYELAELGLHADRPTTSGTWHLDSDSVTTDPRHRMKVLLDTYVNDSNVTEDDAVSNAATHIQFANPDYQIYRIFVSKGIDAIASIAVTDSKPLYTHNHYPYAFDETVQIELAAINKQGITAANLIEKFEQEIRHVFTDHPLGSIREITSIDHTPRRIGDDLLWTTTLTISYRRANDDYTPTYPTFSHGIAFTYEGDRLTNGSEGTWDVTNHKGGSTILWTANQSTANNLYCDLTVFVGDAYTHNETNLGLSTTTYGRCRFRYKTSGAAKAKIILEFSDASTQTILSESASSTFTVGDVAITTAKTLDHINLYTCDDVGTVTYDFIQIYAGTYTIPNLTRKPRTLPLKEALIEIPGMSGNLSQQLGSDNLAVEMESNLDIAPSALTWKRPQATTPKTDVNDDDIFDEMIHLLGIQVQWTWLNLGGRQFKALLVNSRTEEVGTMNTLNLTWAEYRHGSASGETYAERYGTAL